MDPHPHASDLGHTALRGKLIFNLGMLCALVGCVALFANWCMSVVAIYADRMHAAAVLSDLAQDVTEQTLECRRYEKDIFLNIADAATRRQYVKNWEEAFANLNKAVELFSSGAVTAEDRDTAADWQKTSQSYQANMKTILKDVDAGVTHTPEQANHKLYKDSIRQLTQLATDTAHRKAAESRKMHSELDEVIGFFKTSILIVTVVAVLASILWSYRLVKGLSATRRAMTHQAAPPTLPVHG